MKIKEKRNNSGFTLVELLAVIVILAVLIMFAMPAVTDLMEKANTGTFVTEAQEFAKYIDTAYTMSMMNGSFSPEDDRAKIDTPVEVTVDGTNKAKYTYFCYSVKQMVKEQYITKDVGNYSGIIEVFMPYDLSKNSYKTMYGVSMSNGTLVIDYVTTYALGNKSYISDNKTGGVYSKSAATATKCAKTTTEVGTRFANYITGTKNSNIDIAKAFKY